MKRWNKKGGFDIINEISENFTLMQFMESLGNVNHALSIVGYRVFDSNYEKYFRMTRESLDLIYSPSVGEEQVVKFETLCFSFIYMWALGNLKIG